MDLFDLVAKLTLDSSEYEKGIGDAQSTAQSVGGNIGSALGNAGKIAGAAFAATTGAAIATGTALVKSAGDVAEYGDNIDKMSQKMGLTAEAYQEWDAVMQHSGTSMETMKASMKTLASAAEKGNDAFATLGITEEQLANMNQQDIFEATIAGLQQVEDDTQRTYLAGQLLGRGATELGALLNTSAEETQAMRDRVHELGGVMSDEAVKASAKYQDTLQDMTTAFDGMKRGIVSDFLPAITEGMEGLTDIMGGDMTGGLDKLNGAFDAVIAGIVEKLPVLVESVSTVGLALVDAFLSNLPKFAETGLQIITQLGNGIAEALPELINTLTESFVGVLEALTNPDTLTGLLDAGLAIIKALIEGMIQALPAIIEAMPTIIQNIFTALQEGLPMIIEAAVELVTMIAEQLPEIITAILEMLPQIIDMIVETLVSLLPVLVEGSVQLFMGIVEAIPQALPAIVEALPQIIESIVNGLTTLLPEIINAGVELFVSLVENLPEAIVQIVEQLPQIITAIAQGLLKMAPKLIECGVNLMKGLADGVVKGAVAVLKAVAKVGKSIVDAFKKLFKINSPSKVFEEYGKFMDEGLAVGIEGSVDRVSQAMNDMRDATAAPFDDVADEWSTSTITNTTGATGASVASQTQVTAILELDRVQLGKVVFDLNNMETQRMGVNLATGGY